MMFLVLSTLETPSVCSLLKLTGETCMHVHKQAERKAITMLFVATTKFFHLQHYSTGFHLNT